MRLLFLSDTHLGFDLPARPRVARRRRGEDFFRCFEAALVPALRGEVDAVVHGGDLLYRSRVPAWLSEAALAPLLRVAARGVPVLLLPGNHERSRLPHPLLARHPHLHLLDRPRTVLLEARGLRVAFAGFPYAHEVRHRFPALLAAAEADGEVGGPADRRVLCLHQCVEGATCGPGDFTFRGGDDVVRAADLPAGYHLVLCGHVHRRQVLRPPGRPPVLYAGSTERTSFAEAGEEKGAALVDLGPPAPALRFLPLPARPMAVVRLWLGTGGREWARDRLRQALAATPEEAVVQVRLEGPGAEEAEPLLPAAALRALAGGRTVALSRRGRLSSRPPRPAPEPGAPEPPSGAQASFPWGAG